jgi:hypothetical protein
LLRAGALAASLSLLVSGCATHSNLTSAVAAADQSISGVNAEVLEDVTLINTGSILFPWHSLTVEGLEEDRALFLTGEVPITPETYKVTAVAEIHAGPGTNYPVTDILAPGDLVLVDTAVGTWWHLADDRGYVSSIEITRANDGTTTWNVTVANKGGIPELDLCTGGLTWLDEMSTSLGRPVYAIHSHCGGDPLLEMNIGDSIQIDAAEFTVASVADFPLLGSTELFNNLNDEVYVQTSNLVRGTNHLVGLAAVQGHKDMRSQ